MSNTTNSTLLTQELCQKRYSLVKWLENSQFDAENEWFGRHTSVPHTSIIDFDADELKAGIEINVIRNNGEIWRAQIIIPKTSSNTVDLPPSSNKKIRTKAMGTTGTKLPFDMDEQMDTCSSHSETQHDEYEQINKNLNEHNQLIILTNAATSLQINQTNEHIKEVSSSDPQTHDLLKENSKESIVKHNLSNSNNNQKEWQFLQTAINEAGLTDFYQTYNELTNNSSLNAGGSALIQQTANLNKFNSISNNNNDTECSNSHQNIQQLSTVNEQLSIETILQMQSELLEQQKELKNIELETMDHLQQLHQNICRLASKFDLFELSLQGQQNNNCHNNFNNINVNHENNSNNQDGLKTVKNAFNRLNTTVGQQIKLVNNGLLKEVSNMPIINGISSNISTLSPTSLTRNSSSMHNINLTDESYQKPLQNFQFSTKHSDQINKILINDTNSTIPFNTMQLINSLPEKNSKKQMYQFLSPSTNLDTKLTNYDRSFSSIISISDHLSDSRSLIDLNKNNNLTFDACSIKITIPKVEGIRKFRKIK